MQTVSARVKQLEHEVAQAEAELAALNASLPNPPDPTAADEDTPLRERWVPPLEGRELRLDRGNRRRLPEVELDEQQPEDDRVLVVDGALLIAQDRRAPACKLGQEPLRRATQRPSRRDAVHAAAVAVEHASVTLHQLEE